MIMQVLVFVLCVCCSFFVLMLFLFCFLFCSYFDYILFLFCSYFDYIGMFVVYVYDTSLSKYLIVTTVNGMLTFMTTIP